MLHAQEYDLSENLKLRRKGFAFGAHLAGSGWGIDYQYYRYLSEDWEWTIAARFASLVHSRQNKITSIYKDQGGSDFIYDKMNYCYTLSVLYGWQKTIVPLSSNNRLSIKAGLLFGPSLAILKPYYVDVAVPVVPPTIPPQAEIIAKPYSAQILYTDIFGESEFTNGMDNLSGIPGMTLRTQIVFNLGNSNARIRAIQIGAEGAFYFRPVRIMATQINRQAYFQGFIGFLLGSAR